MNIKPLTAVLAATAALCLSPVWAQSPATPEPETPPAEEEISSTAPTGFEGQGTSEDPYLISSVELLEAFRDKVNTSTDGFVGKYFKLTADINLSGIANWKPIGTASRPFSGHFDGGEKTITGLKINWFGHDSKYDDAFLGLFGVVTGVENKDYTSVAAVWDGTQPIVGPISEGKYTAVIKNLVLDKVDIASDCSQVGALAGQVNNTYVENIKVLSGTVASTNSVGGILGRAIGSSLNNLVAGAEGGEAPLTNLLVTSVERTEAMQKLEPEVSFYNYGGIVGALRATAVKVDGKDVRCLSAVRKCTNYAIVNATLTGGGAAGIFGQSSASHAALVYDCHNKGAITGNPVSDMSSPQNGVVSGIAGQHHGSGVIANCTNTGALTVGGNFVAGAMGGMANYFNGTLYNCSNSGTITGNAVLIGGMVGMANIENGEMVVDTCTNSGTVSSTYVGATCSTLVASGRQVVYKNMTFEDTAALQAALPRGSFKTNALNVVSSSTTPLKMVGVTVTDASDPLHLPARLTGLISDTPKLLKEIVLAEDAVATDSIVIEIAGNSDAKVRVVVPEKTTIRDVTISETYNELENRGTVTQKIVVAEAATSSTVKNYGVVKNGIEASNGSIENEENGSVANIWFKGSTPRRSIVNKGKIKRIETSKHYKSEVNNRANGSIEVIVAQASETNVVNDGAIGEVHLNNTYCNLTNNGVVSDKVETDAKAANSTLVNSGTINGSVTVRNAAFKGTNNVGAYISKLWFLGAGQTFTNYGTVGGRVHGGHTLSFGNTTHTEGVVYSAVFNNYGTVIGGLPKSATDRSHYIVYAPGFDSVTINNSGKAIMKPGFDYGVEGNYFIAYGYDGVDKETTTTEKKGAFTFNFVPGTVQNGSGKAFETAAAVREKVVGRDRNPDLVLNVNMSQPAADVDGVRYITLEEAIANASSGATVTLLKDYELSKSPLEVKNIGVLDLGAHTLFGGLEVKCQVTIQNGKVQAKETSAVRLGNFVRTDLQVVLGENLELVSEKEHALQFPRGTVIVRGASLISNASGKAAAYVSNNNIEIVKLIVESGKLKAEKAILFGTGNYISASISGGIIDGALNGAVTVSGGSFDHKIESPILVPNHSCVQNPANQRWEVQPGGGEEATVVGPNGAEYTSLEQAVNTAADNTTLKLNRDINIYSPINVNKPLTLDLGGKTITSSAVIAALDATANLSLTNGTILATSGECVRIEAPAVVDIAENVTLKAKNNSAVYVLGGVLNTRGTLIGHSKYATIQGHGERAGDVNVLGGSVTANNSAAAAIYFPQAAKLTITGGEISGPTAVYFKGTQLEISGGTLTGTGTPAVYKHNGSGWDPTGDALVVEWAPGTYPSQQGDNAAKVKATVTGGIFKTTKGGFPIAAYEQPNQSATPFTKFISGGRFYWANGNFFAGEQTNDINTIQPQNYLADGVASAADAAEKAVEVLAADDDHTVAKVGGKGYATLHSAVWAANLAAETSTEHVTVRLVKDLDLAGQSWTPINMTNVVLDGAKNNGTDETYTISNLTITHTGKDPTYDDAYQGLFGQIVGKPNPKFTKPEDVWNAETNTRIGENLLPSLYTAGVVNLTLLNVSVDSDCSKIGALAGEVTDAYIGNVTVKDCKVWGHNSVGTVIGRGYGVVAENVVTDASSKVQSVALDISGRYNYGGIFGSLRKSGASYSAMIGCTNNATLEVAVTAGGVGGMFGQSSGSHWTLVDGCVNNGTITVTPTVDMTASQNGVVSGIAGQHLGGGVIANCINTGTLTVGGNFVAGAMGGIANLFSGTLYNCSNRGTITGKAKALGGLVGMASNKLVVDACENTGVVNSSAPTSSTPVAYSTNPVEYRNMIFADVAALQAVLYGVLKVGMFKVTVANSKDIGTLLLPATVTSFTASETPLTAIELAGPRTDTLEMNVVGTVDNKVSIVVPTGKDIGVIHLLGSYNELTNYGQMNTIKLLGVEQTFVNWGTVGPASSGENTTVSIGYDPRKDPVSVRIENYGSIFVDDDKYLLRAESFDRIEFYNHHGSVMKSGTKGNFFVTHGYYGSENKNTSDSIKVGTFVFRSAPDTLKKADGTVEPLSESLFHGRSRNDLCLTVETEPNNLNPDCEINGMPSDEPLKSAVNKATSGDTVTLLKDISLDTSLEINKLLMFNFGKHVLTGNLTVSEGGTLDFSNGKVDGVLTIGANAAASLGKDVTVSTINGTAGGRLTVAQMSQLKALSSTFVGNILFAQGFDYSAVVPGNINAVAGPNNAIPLKQADAFKAVGLFDADFTATQDQASGKTMLSYDYAFGIEHLTIDKTGVKVVVKLTEGGAAVKRELAGRKLVLMADGNPVEGGVISAVFGEDGTCTFTDVPAPTATTRYTVKVMKADPAPAQ